MKQGTTWVIQQRTSRVLANGRPFGTHTRILSDTSVGQGSGPVQERDGCHIMHHPQIFHQTKASRIFQKGRNPSKRGHFNLRKKTQKHTIEDGHIQRPGPLSQPNIKPPRNHIEESEMNYMYTLLLYSWCSAFCLVPFLGNQNANACYTKLRNDQHSWCL